MGIKSPRGATVSLKEAQLMKSPTFVLSQLQKEATDWEQFDRAFSDGAGRVASSRLEEYEVLEELGRGRFGEVNKVPCKVLFFRFVDTKTRLGRKKAAKCMR
jgi:hypothetical protein